jgi:hypothetical protein
VDLCEAKVLEEVSQTLLNSKGHVGRHGLHSPLHKGYQGYGKHLTPFRGRFKTLSVLKNQA